MIKGCIFDLDGTLVDSIEDLAYATNEVMKKYSYPTHDLETYKGFVGNGVTKLVERALPKDHKDKLDECLKDFHEIYETHCLDHTLPYEGMNDLINELKKENTVLGVVTNKPHHLAIKIVEHLFPDTFTTILGQQDLYPTKPSPESTMMALMMMKIRKEECLFIGDSEVDIDTAYQSDMDSIGVTWGFRTRLQLQEADASYIVDKPSEIKEIIDENRGE